MSDLLNLYPIDYPFETLKSRVDSKKLKLNPDYQRKYKWDADGHSRGSKFIESCLMRIPLPACYFAEQENGIHEVIDGVQRITTIVNFMNDEFALENLSFLKALEGKKFSQIENFASELEATTIRCVVLRKENPKSIIKEIFARLNQGAVKLTAQEIRHASYPGSLNDLLNDLSKSEAIKKLYPKETNPSKDGRESAELVLRVFAMNSDLKNYDSLEKELDKYMEDNANLTNEKIEELRKNYKSTLEKCVFLFGENSFKNISKKKPIASIAIYDLLMWSLNNISMDKVVSQKDNINNAFSKLCNDVNFNNTMSGGLQQKTSIIKRRSLWLSYLKSEGV